MPANRLRLVVGLGNPGNTYEDTRHNAGFMVADKIAQDFNISFNKTKFGTIFGRGFIEDVDVILVKPMAFMNRSGPPLHGGHNGIRSIMDAFGGGDFVRLRIGVGRSEAEGNVTDHVLGRFSDDKAEMVARVITVARDAAVTVLCEGMRTGMNAFNRKDLLITG